MNYTVIVPFYNEEKNVSRFNNELIKNIMKTTTQGQEGTKTEGQSERRRK